MSGIVGIVNLDHSPVDRALLEKLTNALVFRGPDAQKNWFRGPAGFGHTLLRATKESKNEAQPFTLDENSWIVADARVDGRAELIAKIESHGQRCAPNAPDVELVLGAYQIWGENCVNHLIGDFVFAIWNARARRLFCARDQMGVKPFFYAHIGSVFIFSNTLDCIRLHPAVTGRLNDLSIADFLLFGMIQGVEATAFAEIRRLSPAHTLACEDGEISIRRYWNFSPPKRVQYRRRAEYVEQFRSLMDQAVADRLRTDNACIFMSGGLDSPTVAASAERVASAGASRTDLWALTQVFDNLIPHEERYYAGLVGQSLKIPIDYRSGDDLRLFQFAERPSPEPVHLAWPNATSDHLRRVATRSRVVLTGFGADPLLASRITVHFRDLAKQKRFGRAMSDALGYLCTPGRLSRLYLRTRWRLAFGSKESQSGFFPEWLNEDLIKELDLRNRWNTIAQPNLTVGDSVRPEATALTFASFWASVFDEYDSGVTHVPVDVRHPFFDLRLMNFLLGLPRLPWCSDKELLREAARGILPDSVRLRRKSPLPADPLLALLAKPDAAWVNSFRPEPYLENFVRYSRIPLVTSKTDAWAPWVHLRPISLNYWLRTLGSPLINVEGGEYYECTSTAQS